MFLDSPPARVGAVVVLFVVTGTMGFLNKYSVLDPDVWWHLKVGDWIVQHHAVPHNGIFSYTGADRPWVAYSWGFEVLLSAAYALFGLPGMAWFGIALTLLVMGTLLWALNRLTDSFWLAFCLCAAACFAFLFNIAPRPVLFSMTLFIISLTLILRAVRESRIERLYWLPLLFAVWTNLHIQFVYGLFLIGLLATTTLAQRVLEKRFGSSATLTANQLPVLKVLLVCVGCVVASGFGPYSYHLFRVVFEYSRAKVAYSMIGELLALSFTTYAHFLLVLLTAIAYFVVGWQRRVDLFKSALLLIATVVAFRTRRDAWFIAVTAALIISDTVRSMRPPRERTKLLIPALGGATAGLLCLFVIAELTGFNSSGLQQAIRQKYPVDAANFLRSNPASGPLYNNLGWGGFLIWYLPQYPVAIDGRNDIYGDAMDAEIYSTEKGEVSYAANRWLNNAGIILLDRHLPLAGVLSMDARYRVLYQDDVSVVLVRQ